MGELQRLAVGRVLLAKPKMIFLDEATSALDSPNEDKMYQELQKLKVPIINVGHHQRLATYHDFVLKFKGESQWEIVKT